jgi:hypothetical protein
MAESAINGTSVGRWPPWQREAFARSAKLDPETATEDDICRAMGWPVHQAVAPRSTYTESPPKQPPAIRSQPPAPPRPSSGFPFQIDRAVEAAGGPPLAEVTRIARAAADASDLTSLEGLRSLGFEPNGYGEWKRTLLRRSHSIILTVIPWERPHATATHLTVEVLSSEGRDELRIPAGPDKGPHSASGWRRSR